jgi:hypothetical protein
MSWSPICNGVTMAALSSLSYTPLRSMRVERKTYNPQRQLRVPQEREVTYGGYTALVDGVGVAVDGEEVREALSQFLIIRRLARKVQHYQSTQYLHNIISEKSGGREGERDARLR